MLITTPGRVAGLVIGQTLYFTWLEERNRLFVGSKSSTMDDDGFRDIAPRMCAHICEVYN